MRDGVFHTLVGVIADRLAAHPTIPQQSRQAFRDAVVTTIYGSFSEMRTLFPGEQLRLYLPKFSPQERKDRAQRISAALDAGEAPESIAKRERITPRRVRQLRGRIG